MSGFYASKLPDVASVGGAHNDTMRKLYPTHEDRVKVLNSNILFALTGDIAEVRHHRPRHPMLAVGYV